MTAEKRLYLGRKPAANYLNETYGFGTKNTLAKDACLGGGPIFRKAGRRVLYTIEDLDNWAREKISPPIRSTSEKIPQKTKLNNPID